jgi:hypothetical protein
MIPGFFYYPVGFQYSILKADLNIAGLRPRATPYSFATRQKSKQKNAPRLLARLRRVPSAERPAGGRKKTRSLRSLKHFSAYFPHRPLRSGCVTGDLTATAKNLLKSSRALVLDPGLGTRFHPYPFNTLSR